jgi:DNA helicase HerA-like ATPase
MSDTTGAQAATTALYQQMWRDGRKYKIFLHPIVQSPADMPPGILSSCNNLVVGQLKNAQDRDVAQAALGWSEKGFTDEDYKRYISRMPVGYAVMKLGYSMQPALTAPMLVRPILLDIPEPTDAEIWAAAQASR